MATVPTSVTVPAGATSATFPVTTRPVTTSGSVRISASGGGATRSATLTVNPAPVVATLASVSLNPASVVGETGSTGTVRLSAVAPAGGAMVTLSSSGAAAATVPASVAVLAGATSATFSVATAAVTATANVTVSASYGGVTRTANLAVMVAGSISRVFGYDTIDGFSYASHNWPLANNQQVQPATLTEPGLLTSIRTYFYSVADAPGSAMRVRGLVYADAVAHRGR